MPQPRTPIAFDLETVAAGYADPEWVPHTVTAWAWSAGGDDMHSDVLAARDLYDVSARAAFLEPLLVVLRDAQVVSAHNGLRFDLPVLQAEAMRLGLEPLPPKLVVDTIRLRNRTKGFKKGQDNLGVLLRVKEQKLPLNHQQWMDAYASGGHVVRERVESDVRQHIMIRDEMAARGWLRPPMAWSG